MRDSEARRQPSRHESPHVVHFVLPLGFDRVEDRAPIHPPCCLLRRTTLHQLCLRFDVNEDAHERNLNFKKVPTDAFVSAPPRQRRNVRETQHHQSPTNGGDGDARWDGGIAERGKGTGQHAVDGTRRKRGSMRSLVRRNNNSNWIVPNDP